MIGSLPSGAASVLLGRESVLTAAGSSCSCPPSGPVPPTTGLVQWVKGDDLTPGESARVALWPDNSPRNQDFLQANPSLQPYVLGATIDGVPLVTFGTAGAANKAMATAANFVDRFGVAMDGASARTVMAVIQPQFDAAWGVTGGLVWGQSNWQALFDLESTFVASGAYAFARAWRNPATACDFTPVTGGSGGPYDGTPTLTEHRSPASPAIQFLLNNVLTALNPATMPGVAGGPAVAEISVPGPIAFLGGLAELLVWDYDLSTDAAAHAQAIAYIATRYPSVPVVA